MPKRSNAFQQLVFLIQHQLAGTSGAIVSESKMLADRVDDTPREADIVVEIEQHGVPMTLCFECKDQTKRIDLTQLEQLATKYKRLCDKLVVVSRNGFTKPALIRAASEGIAAVTISAASSIDWKAYIEQYSELFFGSFDFQLLDHVIEYEISGGVSPLSKSDPFVISRRNGLEVPFDHFKKEVLGNSDLGKQAMERWYAVPVQLRKPTFEFGFDFEPAGDNPLYVIQGGNAYRLKRFRGKVLAKVSSAPIHLSPLQFQDACVLDGNVELSDGKLAGKSIRVLLTKRLGEATLGTVVIPSNAEGLPAIQHYRIDSESGK